MHDKLHPLATLSGCVLLSMSGVTVFAQSVSTLKDVMSQRDAAVRKIQTESDTQKADLFDKYAGALETLSKQFSAKGDLDRVLVIKSEIEAARTKRGLSDGMLPEFGAHRATLTRTLAAIDENTRKAQSQVDVAYLRSLNQMKVELTKAGKLEEAIAVDKEIKNVSAGTAPTVSTSAANDSAASTGGGGKAPIDFEKPVIGEFTLPPNTYRLRNPIVIGGDRKEKGAEIVGTVVCVPGTQFESAEIFVREGLLACNQVLFKGSKLAGGLGGRIEAKDSLFSESQMQKSGPWFIAMFTSKWTFENCAFSRSFFPVWKVADVGVKITNCTFHDVEFADVTYKNDAGSEVAAEWMTIRECRFVGCRIPESFFLATKDCAFENCRFETSKDKVPIATPIKLRAYVSDVKSVPAAPPLCSYELVDLNVAPKQVGASLRYQRVGRGLKF